MMKHLTAQTILDALEAIRRSQPISGNPLLEMQIVQQHYPQYRDFPAGYQELRAIRTLFNDMLLACLGTKRANSPSLAWLKQDYQLENLFVESYSLLYYRYLCPELALSMQQIARITNTAMRTLQRRQKEGTQHLPLALLDAELRLKADNHALA